ncbi:MAG: Gfo/Idh/MocA family oxidoreductase, partial [bacterium]|nr:Gfo/Idh/MocA family oxidoreductase [bacterium]
DVYQRQRERSAAYAPGAKQFEDYRHALDDARIDGVLIATPPHLHCRQFVDSLAAGKHVYVERTMAFDAEQARTMRDAALEAGRVVQVGHQFCSSGQVLDAQRFVAAGWVGQITAIRSHSYRNTPHGKPQWARPVFPGLRAADVNWEAFLGEAPRRDFDPNRFVNWRYFWDYSGGNVHETMSQQVAFWYRTLDLEIPHAVTMTGGLFRWQDGREVPDTMHVSMEHASGLLFTWDAGFGNNQLGNGEYVLGTDGTIHRCQQIRYLPQKVNRPGGRETMGRNKTEPRAHMRNFLDSIRGAGEPNCGVETGYRVSITCRMALESFWQRRTVYWDAEREDIV